MTTLPLGTQLLALPAIFDGHLFTIPDYQRGYAWGKEQVLDLLKDIDHLMNDGMVVRHYTGTLVLSQPGGHGNGEFDVVDGQQRLTTLVILIRVLSEHLPVDEREKLKAWYLWRGGVGNQRAVLRLNSDTRQFFERVVLGDGNPANEPSTLEAHAHLLKAREEIEKWLDGKLKDGKSAEGIRTTVETELGFLVYAPQEDAETGIMFEVINNRGKSLSELEKVKNFLIYCCVKLGAKELRESINADWSKILSYLNTAKKTSSADEGAFLRYCVAVHFKLNKTDSQDGYKELKDKLEEEKTREAAISLICEFARLLKNAALWYARLYGRQHMGLEPALIPVLDQLRAQDQHASIMPLFLALVIKLQGKGDRLVRLLKLLEILNFRVYMALNMTKRNDSGQGYLYQHASSYYHDELLRDFTVEDRQLGSQLLQSEEDALEFRLVKFVLEYASENQFKKSFVLNPDSKDDFYDWSGLRYFLMNYEAKLQPHKTILIDKILLSRQKVKTADYLSVEHIWALKNREGENNRKVDSIEKRRLGNFVLLELRINIKGRDDSLEKKLSPYMNGVNDEPPTDLAQVRRMGEDAKEELKSRESEYRTKNYYTELHRALNDRQEKRYTEFAEERWSVKEFLGYQKLVKDAETADDE